MTQLIRVLIPAHLLPSCTQHEGASHFCGYAQLCTVGSCNKVFPIVPSRPGLCCHAPRVKKFHKHSSTVNLTAQTKTPF